MRKGWNKNKLEWRQKEREWKIRKDESIVYIDYKEDSHDSTRR